MKLFKNYCIQNININPDYDEAQNITFIDFTNYQISFLQTNRINQLVGGAKFNELNNKVNKNSKEMHPFLR
jgi:hypothetical protein